MRLGSPPGGREACGWWSGMPARSGQIPPPWAWWKNEAPTTRAALVRGIAASTWTTRLWCRAR
jgi:hypothetical protein